MQGGGFGGGGMHGEELSPEDLFRFFFGQQGGAQFGGGGGGFRTQFYGPGGMRTGPMGGGARAAAGGAAGQQPPQSIWLQIAPLLVIVAFSILTQIPSFFGSSGIADPDFAFRPAASYNIERTTFDSKISYFVNAQQFSAHPIYAATLAANPSLRFTSRHAAGTKEYRNDLLQHIMSTTVSPLTDGTQQAQKIVAPPSLKAFEKKVERSWVHSLQSRCQVRCRFCSPCLFFDFEKLTG